MNAAIKLVTDNSQIIDTTATEILRKETYALIPTNELIGTIAEASPKHVKIVRTHVKGTQRVTFRDTQTEIMLADGTTIMPQIYLKNAEKPGHALILVVGCFRLICSNGLVVGAAEKTRLVHRVGPTVDNFLETLHGKVAAMWDEVASGSLEAKINPMIRETRVTEAMQANILANLYLSEAISQQVYYTCLRNYYRRVEDDNSLWGLFNYVQEIMTRSSNRRSEALAKKNDELLDTIRVAYRIAA